RRVAGESVGGPEVVAGFCGRLGVPHAVAAVVQGGGAGGEALAQAVLEVLERAEAAGAAGPSFRPAYDWNLPIEEKLEILARDVYGADGVVFTPEARRDIKACQALGVDGLPVCVAKTQHSVSDQPHLKGAPKGWKLTVSAVRPNVGAGFLVCLAGDVMTMPGLPKRPAALDVDVSEDGEIYLPV